MKFLYYIYKARKLPFRIVLLKATNLLWRNIKARKVFLKDQLFSTYIEDNNKKINVNKLKFYLINLNELKIHNKMILDISNHYFKHYFDILGSGWTKVFYSMKARGLEGHNYTNSELTCKNNLVNRIVRSNLKQAQTIISLIDSDYEPIDWQLDFKSGYRWSEKEWYMNIKYGHKPGVDIKIPWELSRMQHLAMLVWAYMATSDQTQQDAYVREFRNQILDFIANNPPRFGVNWRCTMDVGIRVANWLIAYDLFKAAGAEFDMDFEQIFAKSVYDHSNHIINNLEYTPHLRSNHYLSNIAGLLFAAAHLESNEEIDRWLAFAVQELISEMEHEFHPDGSNFEASTSYHRLSTEIMLYCAILCLILPEEKKQVLLKYSITGHCVKPRLKAPSEQLYDLGNKELFPTWFWDRLEKACEFTLHIIKLNGETPQIGDNDSGRFLKLWPSYNKMTVNAAVLKYCNLKNYEDLPNNAMYYDENILDHKHILAVGGVLFNRKDFLSIVGSGNLERHVIKGILVNKSIVSYHRRSGITQANALNRFVSSSKDLLQWQDYLKINFGQPKRTVFSSPEDLDLTNGLQVFSYPDFGLYLYKSKHLYLAIRCGSVGQVDNGGHAHNDQLSIELNIAGKELVCDPGTYIYTPLPERRNQFRSTFAHFTPQLKGKEQNEWINGVSGLFSLTRKANYKTYFFDHSGFIGSHNGFGCEVYRVVIINRASISILDYCSDTNIQSKIPKIYSNGYGKWIKNVEKF